MKTLLLLSAAFVLNAQVCIMYKPVPLGKGFNFGGYQIGQYSFRSGSSEPRQYSRESVSQLFPEIDEIPDDGLAQDLLSRAAANTAPSLVVSFWSIFKNPAQVALVTLGALNHQNGPLWISAGLGAADLIVNLVGKHSPQPQRYYSRLLPPVVPVPNQPGGNTYGIVSHPSNVGTLGPRCLDVTGAPEVDAFSPARLSYSEEITRKILTAHLAGLKALEEAR